MNMHIRAWPPEELFLDATFRVESLETYFGHFGYVRQATRLGRIWRVAKLNVSADLREDTKHTTVVSVLCFFLIQYDVLQLCFFFLAFILILSCRQSSLVVFIMWLTMYSIFEGKLTSLCEKDRRDVDEVGFVVPNDVHGGCCRFAGFELCAKCKVQSMAQHLSITAINQWTRDQKAWIQLIKWWIQQEVKWTKWSRAIL